MLAIMLWQRLFGAQLFHSIRYHQCHIVRIIFEQYRRASRCGIGMVAHGFYVYFSEIFSEI